MDFRARNPLAGETDLPGRGADSSRGFRKPPAGDSSLSGHRIAAQPVDRRIGFGKMRRPVAYILPASGTSAAKEPAVFDLMENKPAFPNVSPNFGGHMLELQEWQHRRVVMLGTAALVFAAFAIWHLFSGAISEFRVGDWNLARREVYLLSASTLMVTAVVNIVVRSFLDMEKIRLSELYDRNTKLPNRRHFADALRAGIAGIKPGYGFAVVIVDIRRMKAINQGRGYVVGDEAIRETARRLAEMSPQGAELARFDGDRFAFAIANVPQLQSIHDFGKKLAEAFREPLALTGGALYLDIAIGAAMTERRGDVDESEILRRAEIALLEAKSNGDQILVLYDENFAMAARRLFSIETELRQSIENGTIAVAYQPLVDTSLDKVVAVEALARWRHPEFGPVSPSEFIRIAESLGLIGKLGVAVMRTACAALRPLPGIRLAVNISPRHFLDPAFPGEVAGVLRETGLDANRLEIEITENVLILENERAIEAITKLRELGVSIALDDFGTGYSGLSYLHRLPVDRLKIDASFVREIGHSRSAQTMLATIVDLARSRDIAVTVEGVETVEHVRFLSRLGYLWFQGYLFSKPISLDELRDKLRPAMSAPQVRQVELALAS